MEQGIIKIKGLRVKSRLGVTDAERANAQEVSLNIRMVPDQSLFGLNDCIENTIDYFEVSESVKKLSTDGERKLIETLAEELIGLLLTNYPLREVSVSICKYVLSDTDHVEVSMSKTS